ncbi:MAG: hypothetical protein WBB74_12520 [Gaiellaceae bacterium]
MAFRSSFFRRAGPVGIALTAWDIWRRLPKRQRKAILRQARKHGPTVVKQARKHGPTIYRGVRSLRNLRKR